MTTEAKKRDPVFVVVQLSGGNDFLNTVIPYSNPFYKDFRNTVGIADEDVLKFDDDYGFHPSMPEIRDMYEAGDVAIISDSHLMARASAFTFPAAGCIWRAASTALNSICSDREMRLTISSWSCSWLVRFLSKVSAQRCAPVAALMSRANLRLR